MTDTKISAEVREDRMQLWFFRDLSNEQRVKLLRLCFYPDAEFATHSSQQIAFCTLLAAPASRHQEPVEPAGSIYGDYTPITINAPVPKEPGVKVKPLEWWENDPAPAGANVYSYIGECTSLVGFYRIGKAADGWVLRFNGGVISRGLTSLDEAKAAAQADYEQRIRTALEPQPAPVVTDEMVDAGYKAAEKVLRGTSADIGVGELDRLVRAALTASLQKQESGE